MVLVAFVHDSFHSLFEILCTSSVLVCAYCMLIKTILLCLIRIAFLYVGPHSVAVGDGGGVRRRSIPGGSSQLRR